MGKRSRRNKAWRGFTLVELLVVIAIIAILAGLVLAAIVKAKGAAARMRAQEEARFVAAAVKEYVMQYGSFPHGNGSADYEYGRGRDQMGAGYGVRDNRLLLNALRAIDDGDSAGNAGHRANTRQVMYFEASSTSFDADGNLVDPWNRQYGIVCDTDFDNTCVSSGAANLPAFHGQRVVVYSLGPRGALDHPENFIGSWE